MTVENLIPVCIERKTEEAEGIAGFELVPANRATELPEYAPGAHIDVHIPGGPVRQYSLCGEPGARDRYAIAVLRDPASRGGSAAMHDRLHAGSTLEVSAPRNHFPLDAAAKRSLLLAGGIGVTPIIAMADRLAAVGADFEFHYCTRSVARTAFLQRLRGSAYADRVRFHYDDGPAAQKLELAKAFARPDATTRIYVCGPKPFLDAVRASAADQGWSDHQVRFEYFAGPEPHAATDRSFELVLRRTQLTVRVEAEQTCTEALAAAGIVVPTSCEQGVCGTCLTTVLEGEVDHRDLFLTPEEQAANDQFLPCCSRARTRSLVLDL